MTDTTIRLELPSPIGDEPSWSRYGIILFPREHRDFFPGYKHPFTIDTDNGQIEAWVTAAPSSNTTIGDPQAGAYLCSPRKSERTSGMLSILEWYRMHQDLEPGDLLILEHLQENETPGRNLYRLDFQHSLVDAALE